MPAKIVVGNILDATEQYICHQCNCISKGAAGLAQHMFEKFPWSDIYSSRKAFANDPNPEERPGNIIIKGNGQDQRFVINMMGQYYPGYPQEPIDGVAQREKSFLHCLKRISIIDGLTSIAFPWLIGCGLAGGNWGHYQKMIDDFADENPHINVVIYMLPEFAK